MAAISGSNIGLRFKSTRAKCIKLTAGQPQFEQDWYITSWVAYVFGTLTELDKAILASRQYMWVTLQDCIGLFVTLTWNSLTLWPAFVGVIASFGPDPSVMMFDNLWWACLFAMTCCKNP